MEDLRQYLIYITSIGMKIGVFNQLLFGAFEQTMVHQIKPDQSSEQANIRKRQSIPTQVSTSSQVLFQHIQCVEQLVHRNLVRLLGLCKPTPATTPPHSQTLSQKLKRKKPESYGITYRRHC